MFDGYGLKRCEMTRYYRDNDWGCITGLVVIAAFLALVYVAVLAAAVIAIVMAVGGAAYGGGIACKNYYQSFRRNVIDSNRWR